MKSKTIHILTLFPEMFESFLNSGVIGRALSGERSTEVNFQVNLVQIRDFAKGNYKSVDDYPFGGGAGMVMRADVLSQAIREGVFKNKSSENFHVVFPSPRGQTLTNKTARSLASKYLSSHSEKEIIFICGRYEGIDERFLEKYVDEYISLGDFILTGGELAVMSILDTSLRFVDGILGNKLSAIDESFENNLLEYPQYTRPREFEGVSIPEVLQSGHHKNIEAFKKEESIKLTKKFRNDLWEKYEEN